MPKRSKLIEAEEIGKTLQERKKGPTEADYRRLYDQVQAGHLTQRQAALELGTSKGDIYRKFKGLEKSESGSGARGKAQKAKSPSFHVETPPQPKEQAPQPESRTWPKFETGIQYIPVEQLDNTRYQPRAIIKAPADMILDVKLRGGNIYPVLVQRSTGAVADGHRRVDAIAKINAEHPKKPLLVKCDVQELTDQETALLAYQANVLSSPLSEGERDKWIYSLMSVYNLSTKQICDETGLAETTLSNIRRAFEKTTDAVKERLQSGKISTGVAKALASLQPAQQTRLVKKAESKKLTVQQVDDEASELRGRDETRKKLHAHLYAMEPRLVGTIEVENREQWRTKVLRDTFGTPYSHRESGHLVRLEDVVAAEKMLGITVVEKKVVEALCKSCRFEQAKKCDFNHKMPRHVCEDYLPSEYPSYKGPTKCLVCGGWTFDDIALKGEKVGVEYGTHQACLQAGLVMQGALSGLCAECSNLCGTATSVCKSRYDEYERSRLGKVMKRLNVTECSEMRPKIDIKALNERAEQRVMEAIAKFHRDDKTIAANHQIEHAREVMERADLEKQVAKATAPEPAIPKAEADAGPVRPKGPAHFRDAEPATKEETA